MTYTDSTRGTIIYRDRKRQIIDFSGIRYGNITPSDLDGFFERRNRLFVFFEMKFKGVEMPYGQRLALTRLVDVVQSAGKEAIVIVCEHEIPVDKDIDAATCIVKKYYYKGTWYKGEKRTVKNVIDSFMGFADKKYEERINIVINFSQLTKKEMKEIISTIQANLRDMKNHIDDEQYMDNVIENACALITFLGEQYLKE